MEADQPTAEPRQPTLFQSLIPIFFLVAILASNVYVYEDDASFGPNQIGLLITAAVTAFIAVRLGYKWKQILDGMVKSISSAMAAILILLLIQF